MRKKLLLFFALLTMGVGLLQGQVTIALQVPPVGIMQKNQLWNMALVYTGDYAQTVKVELTLLSTKDNQPVMTAVSRPILLAKGTNQVTAKDASPVQYNFLSPVFNSDRDPNGFLPVGSYKACYTVSSSGSKGVAFAEDCLPVEIQPLSPPQLNMPPDTSTVETSYPQFSWLPPMPLNLFSNLTYNLILVEVKQGQSPYEAIQQNVPLYNLSRYRDVVNMYPASARTLDTGRLYAWRILAMNEGDFISQSEVWSFKLAKRNNVLIKPSDGNYYALHRENGQSGLATLSEPIIGAKYYSYEQGHIATIRFLSGDGKVVRAIDQQIEYGENYLGFALDGRFQKGKVYRIELADQQSNIYTTSFIIK